METLNNLLPIFVYFLLIILIIIAIILGIKLILTINKVDKVVDNVEDKVNSLNDFFDIVSVTTNRFELIYSKASDIITGVIDKLFRRKDKDVNDLEDEDEGDED